MKPIKVLKQTKSVCPECLLELDASLIRNNDQIVLERECIIHGEFSTIISNNPDEYEDLFNYYQELISINKKKRIKKQYTIFYTNKCNLNCPICFMNANFRDNIPDPSNESLRNWLRTIRRGKVNIFGGEPTIREDLPELISLIKKSRNLSALFTNGIKISDLEYLKTLKDAGLDEVHLQFDGFNGEVDLKFRDVNLLENKMKALENAKILKIPVILEVTLDRASNFIEIPRILDYALTNWQVRGVCLRSYCVLGKRGVEINRLTIDDLVADIERCSQGKIKKKEIFVLQKLAYIMAEWFNFDWCFSHRYMLIYRKEDKSYLSLGEIVDFERIEWRLGRYLSIRRKNALLAKFYFIFVILPNMLKIRSSNIFLYLLKVILVSKFCYSLTPSSFKKTFLVIDFESPCDRFTFDLQRVCNTGVVGEDLRIYPSFYEASLEKERFFQRLK